MQLGYTDRQRSELNPKKVIYVFPHDLLDLYYNLYEDAETDGHK